MAMTKLVKTKNGTASGMLDEADAQYVSFDERGDIGFADDTPYDVWYGAVTTLLQRAKHVPWQVGDAFNIGEALYGESFSQALDEYDETTIRNMKWVARVFPPSERRYELTMAHHKEVARLAGDDMGKALELLDHAVDEGLSSRDLKRLVREHSYDTRRAALTASSATTLALPEAGGAETPVAVYSVLVCNPPWEHDWAQVTSDREPPPYDTLKLPELIATPIPALAARDALLFLWAPPHKLDEALAAIRHWGFRYLSNCVWDQITEEDGYWLRGQHSHLLMAKRGDMVPPAHEARLPSFFSALRPAGWNRKPLRAYELIDAMYPRVPKLELFGDPHARTDLGWAYCSDIGADYAVVVPPREEAQE